MEVRSWGPRVKLLRTGSLRGPSEGGVTDLLGGDWILHDTKAGADQAFVCVYVCQLTLKGKAYER